MLNDARVLISYRCARVAMIGSRKTPSNINREFEMIGRAMAKLYTELYSGGAEGADEFAQRGFQSVIGHKMSIILPQRVFNGNAHDGVNFFSLDSYSPDLILQAEEIAKSVHPHWTDDEPLTGFPRRAHTRNCFQVLGHDLCTPVNAVIFYAPVNGNSVKGGTRTAVTIARRCGIPTFNFAVPEERQSVLDVLELTGADLRHFM